MSNLLVRVDSTQETGMGHFMRTLALAQKWQKEKGDVFFLINDNLALKERIKQEKMNFFINPSKTGSMDDCNNLIKIAKENKISWIVVDGYNFNENYFDLLRNNDLKFLLFDDDARLNHYNADIVLNQNLHGKKEWYEDKKEEYTNCLIGTNYVLLRNEFLKYIDYKKEIKDKVINVLITLGGSDSNNYSLEILKVINKLNNENLKITVVIGANNPHEEILKNFVKKNNSNVQILKNISNMPNVMEKTDLAFSSGGSTIWELAFMGVPTIVGSTVPVEEILLNGLNENNLFKTIGNLENLDKGNLYNIFKDLMYNKEKCEKMSRDAQKFIDGYGSQRIINFME